ncbi:hypothetical protein H9L39_16654 [Fusarium oxysporum f. sp. albedinis]|nr:hypothetical protein H9L39_16654 [Fusarium oxysporum f. sp. albedinis]
MVKLPTQYLQSEIVGNAVVAKSRIVNSTSLPEVTGTPLCPVANTPLFNGISANPVLTRPAIQTQAAIRGHLDLLTGLLVATPSDEAVSIANHYILLYTKFVFGAIPIWHEATLRATVKRFFISVSAKELHTNGFAQVSCCFTADNKQE